MDLFDDLSRIFFDLLTEETQKRVKKEKKKNKIKQN